MKSAQRFLFSCLFAVAAAGLAVAQAGADRGADADSRRSQILDLAERYASIEWTAEERHFFHGDDQHGVRVDTPDVSLDKGGFKVGEGNVGMPYCWGGFTSLDSFAAELKEKRWAGHVPQRGNAMSSARTIGVDCSGLVSRCWNLPVKQSTRSLGALCYELSDYDSLLPGDIVNRFDAHVAIFVGWEDEGHTKAQVIEAARLKVERSVYDVQLLRDNGFLPMRYKPLDDRWWPMPKLNEVEGLKKLTRPGFEAESARAASDSVLSPHFQQGKSVPGEWARYDTSEDSIHGMAATCTWMAVESTDQILMLQRRLNVGPDTLDTGATLSLDSDWPVVLSAFGNFSDPQQDLKVIEKTITEGTYRFGEHDFDARRVQAVIKGNNLSRSTLYPIELTIDFVLSDEVPLLGVCEATMKLKIDYGERDGQDVIGTSNRHYALIEFGGE